MTEVVHIYEANAAAFDRDRGRCGMEKPYLDAAIADLSAPSVLDLGCGAGEPIARYLIECGCRVTGVDASAAMIALCAERFPAMTWIDADMRHLALDDRFDVVVAWDSFFHLPPAAQRDMFPIFARHMRQGGRLLFTSGPANGVAMGQLYGEPLYHASLDAEEYRSLLRANGFAVLRHAIEDPACGGHTVWLAEARLGG